MLSAATAILSESHKAIVTYFLVGIVFSTAVAIVMYRIHLRCCAKSALWIMIKSKMPRYRQGPEVQRRDASNVVDHSPTNFVSKTEINLREPLLENSG